MTGMVVELQSERYRDESSGAAPAGEERPAAPASSSRRLITPAQAKISLMAADFLTACLAIGAAFATQAAVRPVASDILHRQMLLAAITLPLWLLALVWMHLYTARFLTQAREEMRRIAQAVLVGSLFVLATGFFLHLPNLSRLWIGSLFVWALVFLATERLFARRVFRRLRSSGRLVRRIAVVGSNEEALHLADMFEEHPELGYQVVGFLVGAEVVDDLGAPVLGTVAEAESVIAAYDITGVVVAVTALPADTTNQLVRHLTDAHVHVEVSSSLRDIAIQRFRLQSHDGHPVVYVEPTVREGWRAVAKRTFDVAFSVLALVLASPVLLVAAVAIVVDSRGPVLFRQERVGRAGKPFRVLKLRTMTVDAEARRSELLDRNEADGPLFKMRNDPRVTRVGRLLRALSIDEIPQFWNVIRGEMSVVGPRPALPSETDRWSPALRDRLRVKPGITGSWQVSGRSAATFEQYQRLDLYYVDNWSLSHDVAIVLKTVPAVLARRGAS